MDTNTEQSRYARQNGIIDRDKLERMVVTVIGVGAIGRQVALQLASIGVAKIQIIDFDTVELTNLTTQGYYHEHLGKPKVEATKETCDKINNEIEVLASNEKCIAGETPVYPHIFCCVDSIKTREEIFNAVSESCNFFVDGRMSAETLRVVTATDAESKEHYKTTVFPEEQAYTGSCTAQSTIYCANIAAGIMVSQFTKYLREHPLDKDINYNILANELVC